MNPMEKIKRNPINAIAKWFREVRSELKKVVWPSFEKTRQNTIVVMVYVVVVGAIIWILDFGFVWLMAQIPKL